MGLNWHEINSERKVCFGLVYISLLPVEELNLNKHSSSFLSCAANKLYLLELCARGQTLDTLRQNSPHLEDHLWVSRQTFHVVNILLYPSKHCGAWPRPKRKFKRSVWIGGRAPLTHPISSRWQPHPQVVYEWPLNLSWTGWWPHSKRVATTKMAATYGEWVPT